MVHSDSFMIVSIFTFYPILSAYVCGVFFAVWNSVSTNISSSADILFDT